MIVPGAMFVRRNDDRVGMVIAVKKPYWHPVENKAIGWTFELLVNDMLIYADGWPAGYDLVQLDT